MFKNLTPRRVGYILSIGTVAAVAARVSYTHIYDVARAGHQPSDVSAILPLSVDGLLLAATLAMAEDKANGRKPRMWARVGFWLGAGISVAANVASTVVHNGLDPLAIGVAAWAPVALLVVTEIMARPGKPVEVSESEAQPVKAPRTAQARLADARKRAGYDKMTTTEKAAWTKRYNERIGRTAPASGVPAPVPAGDVPTDAELEDAIA